MDIKDNEKDYINETTAYGKSKQDRVVYKLPGDAYAITIVDKKGKVSFQYFRKDGTEFTDPKGKLSPDKVPYVVANHVLPVVNTKLNDYGLKNTPQTINKYNSVDDPVEIARNNEEGIQTALGNNEERTASTE